MSLYLIGMRGTGKSTAGLRVAELLKVPFLDSDRLVEQRAGQSVHEIFASQGEEVFRLLEREVMLELLQRQGVVVATGGGCVLDAQVRQGLRAQRPVVWLSAPVDALRKRIRGTDRPPLMAGTARLQLEALMAAREPLYERCADQRLDTGTLTVEDVAGALVRLWVNESDC